MLLLKRINLVPRFLLASTGPLHTQYAMPHVQTVGLPQSHLRAACVLTAVHRLTLPPSPQRGEDKRQISDSFTVSAITASARF